MVLAEKEHSEVSKRQMFYCPSHKYKQILGQHTLNVFLVSWYPHRFDKNVLWLHYEDLKQNRRECVTLIAEFLDIRAHDKALQDLVTKQVRI